MYDPADFVIEHGVLTKYNGPGGDVVIPEGVAIIGWNAFEGCTGLTGVRISEGVTGIVDYAFGGCTNLTDVSIPESVTEIGMNAFSGCQACADTVNDIVYIDHWVISADRTIENASIQPGTEGIACSAFSGCVSLEKVHIPKGVTKIGKGAFLYCSSLTGIVIPEGVTKIDDSTFCGCNSLKSITLPKGITEIAESAFDDCSSLTDIRLPEGVTKIGKYAFSDCSSLKKIMLPEGVTEIREDAFRRCEQLTCISISGTVTQIRQNAFDSCKKLQKITVSADNPNYSDVDGVLFDKDLTTLICYPQGKESFLIPDSVTAIDAFAVHTEFNAVRLIIPDRVQTIAPAAFYQCYDLTLSLPEKISCISNSAFKNVNNPSLVLAGSTLAYDFHELFGPKNLPRIYAPNISIQEFKGTKLKKIVILGYLKHLSCGDELSGTRREEYIKYIKTHKDARKAAYEEAAENEIVLHFLMDHQIIPLAEFDDLLEFISVHGTASMKAELLAYKNTSFSPEEQEKFEDRKFTFRL